MGLKTAIRRVAKNELESVTAMFLCNSLIGIWPVASIEGVRDFTGDTTVHRLQQALATGEAEQGKTNWYAS